MSSPLAAAVVGGAVGGASGSAAGMGMTYLLTGKGPTTTEFGVSVLAGAVTGAIGGWLSYQMSPGWEQIEPGQTKIEVDSPEFATQEDAARWFTENYYDTAVQNHRELSGTYVKQDNGSWKVSDIAVGPPGGMSVTPDTYGNVGGDWKRYGGDCHIHSEQDQFAFSVGDSEGGDELAFNRYTDYVSKSGGNSYKVQAHGVSRGRDMWVMYQRNTEEGFLEVAKERVASSVVISRGAPVAGALTGGGAGVGGGLWMRALREQRERERR